MPSRDDRLAKAQEPARIAMNWHPFYQGKIQVMPKCAVRDYRDFAIWYTPGVAAPCRAILADPDESFVHTNRANSVAVVSDGTRVLGLGNIGPEAALPVMEGKALLFKYLGGVDAVPLCVRTDDPEQLIALVRALEPTFGGINLEDIEQPKCFQVLDRLRAEMQIPVWHDDQQGTATVLLAGLLNALKVVGKTIDKIKIAMVGIGAANVATYRLLRAAGIDPAGLVACDSRGTLHAERADIERQQHEYSEKWRVCLETNVERIQGGVAEALRGADVCVAFSASGPGIIQPDWIRNMADSAVVFACANPTPEIWPWEALEAGARIVATGRSDFPNQVNNSLGFPAIFRGALDVRARTISDTMAIAAAHELARGAHDQLKESHLVPRMDQWDVFPRIAVATAMQAQQEGLAGLPKSADQLLNEATARMEQARRATEVLMRDGLIRQPPDA